MMGMIVNEKESHYKEECTMLTPQEAANTAKELQENYRRLNFSRQRVLRDLEMDEDELERVLSMQSPNPSNVWMVRDYLEDMMKEQGIEMYPFSRLADHAANKWFRYNTPWRKNNSRACMKGARYEKR